MILALLFEIANRVMQKSQNIGGTLHFLIKNL